MDKLPTNDQLGKLLVNLALHQLESWGHQELQKLKQNSRFPICLEIKPNHWIIGNKSIKLVQDHCWQVYKDDRHIHDFYSRQAAFFWAIFETQGEWKIAQQILNADRKTAKYCDEQHLFNHRLSRERNQHKRAVLAMRLENAKREFEAGKKELDKSLKNAKYHNIWDNLL